MKTQLFVAAALLTAVSATRASAQSRSLMSVDLTVGTSKGEGGGLRGDRTGAAFDGLVSWHARGRSLLHAVFGFGAGIEGPKSGRNDSCLFVPGTNCVRDFPRMSSFGIFFGAQHDGKLGEARLLVGPTHYRASGGGSTLGGQARFELASPSIYHVALVGSARYGMVWNLDRQDFRMAAVGLGIGIRP